MASFKAFIFITLSCLVVSIDANEEGFSVDLIHRDSPKSPFYNPEETPTERMAKAFHQSIHRVNHFRRLAMSNSRKGAAMPSSSIKVEIERKPGNFLMSMLIGTPPKTIHVYADSGSDLLWTQCTRCYGCFKQVDPLFDWQNSSTYRNVKCASRECTRLETRCTANKNCEYTYSYEDKTYTTGNLAVETITFNSTSGRHVSFPKILFGCGHFNKGLDNGASGVVGLGGGPLSLIKQMGDSIGGRFSYCMIPLSSKTDRTSTMKFGRDAILSGRGIQSTPLTILNSLYHLTLEAISIEDKRIKFPGSSFNLTEGNIIIDSGSTLTSVPPSFFADIALVFDNVVGGKKVPDPLGVLKLCYAINSVRKVPRVTVHFKGANVKLDPSAVLVQVSEDTVCFPVRSAEPDDETSGVFGNVQQSNLLIGYDLDKNTLSFKSMDCTKV